MANILDRNLFNREMAGVVEYFIRQYKDAVTRLENYIEKNGIDPNDMSNEASQNLLFAKNELAAYQKAKDTGNYVSLFPKNDQTKLENGFAGISQSGFDWKEKHMNSEYFRNYLFENREMPVTYTKVNQGVVRGGLNPGSTATTNEKKTVNKSAKNVINTDDIEEPAPEPTPQAQPQQAPSTRLTTATTPAEFKPALMEKEKAKTEEEYLGKDRSKWVNMSTADKVAGLAGLLGDAGGDIVDIVAAAQGIENGGAERLKKRRDEINQRREERKREYQEYLNRVDDINRQIAMHNNNTINNSAMAKFNADNAYRMINYQAQQQAAAQAAAGLYM